MLELGSPLEVPQRDVRLVGTLADGSAVSFDLNSKQVSGEDFFSATTDVSVAVESQSLAGSFEAESAVRIVAGDLGSLADSDDEHLELAQSFRLNSTQRSSVVLETTVPLSVPNRMLVRLESSSQGTELEQAISLFDWNTGQSKMNLRHGPYCSTSSA